MPLKIYVSFVIIALTAAMIGGATMAWFTGAAAAPAADFSAGTLTIAAGEEIGAAKIPVDNWNPGDCNNIKLCVQNRGSKSARLRAKVQGLWTPGPYRLLILYERGDIQLIGFDWDSTCTTCPITNGPLATGDVELTRNHDQPGARAYLFARFKNFSKEAPYPQTGVDYPGWCLEWDKTVYFGTRSGVQLFDPFCNPTWYEGLNVSSRWRNIPWHKLSYILNQDYLSQGYTAMDIQQAIWYFSTGSFYFGQPEGRAQAIVAEVNEVIALLAGADNVSIFPGLDWEWEPDGYWYYTGVVPGTFLGATAEERTICLNLTVCLSGPGTGNEFQGAQYLLYTFFEAVQSSHNASQEVWGWSPSAG